MITALDHFGLVCPDIDAGQAAYEALLGQPPTEVRRAGGIAYASFRVGNAALELMAPDGDEAGAVRLREILDERGPGLTTLVFRTGDLDEAHRILTRRGLAPGEPVVADTYRTIRCADEGTAGIKIFLIAHDRDAPVAGEPAPGGVSALDHLVVNTPNPDRTAALYGARLGLRFALDRTVEEFATRFLFFRVGDLTLEIVHPLKGADDPSAPDKMWGITWAVDDLEAAHTRLLAAGLNVSDMKTGRKPGSRVFTVRDGTLDVPTLFIAHAPR